MGPTLDREVLSLIVSFFFVQYHLEIVTRKPWTGTGAIRRQISLSKFKIDKIQWEQMASRVGSYFQKGSHSATQTELKV